MVSHGKTLRNVFENKLLKIKGLDVFIYSNWQSEQMTSIVARATKEVGESFFEFPINTDIHPENIVQIKDSRDFWRVIDVEEKYQLGVATKLQVRVVKTDQAGNDIHLNSEGQAVFHGNVYGGVQIGGHNNIQDVTLSNKVLLDGAISELVDLIQLSVLSDSDKNNLIRKVEQVKRIALNLERNI